MSISIVFVAALAIGLAVGLLLKRSVARWIFAVSAGLALVTVVAAYVSNEAGEATLPVAMFTLPIACVVSGPAAFVRDTRTGVVAAIVMSSIASVFGVLGTAYMFFSYACGYHGGCL